MTARALALGVALTTLLLGGPGTALAADAPEPAPVASDGPGTDQSR